MAYPFVEPDPGVFSDFKRQLEVSYEIQSSYDGIRGRSGGQAWEAIMHGLHHMKLIYRKDFRGKVFSDCLSLNYEAAMYAALHGFKQVSCIALQDYAEKEVELLRTFRNNFEGTIKKVCGRLQVYI